MIWYDFPVVRTLSKFGEPAELTRGRRGYHRMAAVAADPKVWLHVDAVLKLLGITRDGLVRLERNKLVTVLRIPGCRPRYERASVEALLKESLSEREVSAVSANGKGPGKAR